MEQEPELPFSGQGATALPADNRYNGSYHCERFKKTKKCDVCQHMVETSSVFNTRFKKRHAIAGHNVHDKATVKVKLRWFIYLHECLHPNGVYQYVGSTNCVTERWSNTKSKCNAAMTIGSGREEHLNWDALLIIPPNWII